MSSSVERLTLQFLAWVADGDGDGEATRTLRTYAEAMDAWRTSCPRLTIWDDAIRDGLIQVENGSPRERSIVRLTERGRAMLRRHESI